jgi:hypothetical protein
MWRGTISGFVSVLVAVMGALGILHVNVLVDDGCHVGDGLGVGLEHFPP